MMTRPLSVGVELASDHREKVIRFLQTQPLLPTWRITPVADPGDVGDASATVLAEPHLTVTTPAILGHRVRENETTPAPVVLIVDGPPTSHLSIIGAPGVRGVVASSDPPETLALAIMAAASHGVWLPEAVWERVVQGPGSDQLAALEALTAAETETLKLLARGLTYKQIAKARHVEMSTVKYHVGNIRLKTGASSRHHLIVLAHEAAAALSREDHLPERSTRLAPGA